MNEAILKFIGQIVAYGGGGAVIAYGLFVFLGKKKIENKFFQQLEEYKSGNNQIGRLSKRSGY